MWHSLNKNGKIILLTILAIVSIILFSIFRDNSKLISKKEAIELIDKSPIEKVFVNEPYIYIYTKDKIYKVAKEAIDMNTLFNKTVVYYKEKSSEETINTILFIFVVIFTIYILRLISKNQAKHESIIDEQKELNSTAIMEQTITPQISKIDFSNVAGIEEVKEELREIIDFLKNPQKYRDFDIRLPKGVLLVGPPGVGKTLVAKAVAGEADVPFFYQSAASFVQIYVGMGAKRVSELFSRAKQMAPSIIFIDEIDAVGKSRGGGFSNDEREGTLNQLLTEMDGFEESSGVMVIGATNKIEVLDDALLRAGRFDRRVHIPLPDFKERVSTLKLYLKDKNHNIDIKRVARVTIGFNTAALETLINEAALYALRLDKSLIEDSDIDSVKDKVLLGKHKILSFTQEEQKIQALYQGAKVVTAIWLEVEFDKIGLITSSFIPHHKEILSKTILKNELKVLLAGRVATKEKYNELFTNAKEDIAKAKLLSQRIIEEFAMADNYFSSHIDVETLLYDATMEVKSLLSQLDRVVIEVQNYLLENETITFKEAKRILDEIF